jgi:hypothetical protein
MPKRLVIATLILLAAPTVVAVAGAPPAAPRLADGATPVLTPEGTWITPPPGAPLRILREAAHDMAHGPPAAAPGLGPVLGRSSAAAACTDYRVGWYETNSASLYGGHVGIKPQSMPPSTTSYCPGTGMGYSDGVSFDPSTWIQAGLVIFPGESGAKWFCQSNDNGATSTQYGPASAYANGATVYTWFSRDSSGVWRTYRYDTGPYSIELPCTLARGASGNLQTFGEIQGATSTSAPMGPWEMFDVRYQSTAGAWYTPSQMQAFYPGGTPCPPYGAGTIASGAFSPGSGASCATGTHTYP